MEKLSVQEAREQRVCRVCQKPMPADSKGRPQGWQFDFSKESMPEKITLNFGKEYAHTGCIVGQPQEAQEKSNLQDKSIRGIMINRIREMIRINIWADKKQLEQKFETFTDEQLVETFEEVCNHYYQDRYPNA